MKHKQQNQKMNEQHVRIRREMLDSPAYRALSFSARRILNRIEIEHCRHRGKENGKLTVTYNNFEQYGIHHNAIGPAIREAEALGFIHITQHGRAGNADQRSSNKFRLTYLATDHPYTDEWRHIDSEQAKALAKKARKEKPDGYYHPRRRRKRTCKSPVPGDGTGEPKSPVPVNAETTTVDRYWETPFSVPSDGSDEPFSPVPDTGSTI
jgi:hypothetical protein